ncbi:hypothetical protein NIES21_61250 (plasmid) [Anabaenopsis circularis NIES-21]|uniref:Uncharacterized protein n=1 Tax=Anabaenopsis circularis NIES-21 TaxID=1085406 RepID=A0A1Z4GRW7_9CYAN|nr:hypothetical protein NIES21_61250 [Anabaenopsis circularis NIES-21]
MSAVLEYIENCQNAAIRAGFPAECGREMLEGYLQDLAQGWSQQQFETWFMDMEAKYGSRSKSGISLSCLYRNIMQRVNTDDFVLTTELNSLPR